MSDKAKRKALRKDQEGRLILASLGGPLPPDRVMVRHEVEGGLHHFWFRDPLWKKYPRCEKTLGWTCPRDYRLCP